MATFSTVAWALLGGIRPRLADGSRAVPESIRSTRSTVGTITGRYNARGKVDRTACNATIDIAILNLTPNEAT